MIAMKHLASALAVLSLFAAAPAFASDVSSDRHFAETKALQSRALQSLRTTTEAQVPDSPQVKTKSCASRCSCARSDDPQAVRAEPGGH
jgi:outer membrane lipoprotein-sorting protein